MVTLDPEFSYSHSAARGLKFGCGGNFTDLAFILKPLIAKLRAQNSGLPTATLEILGTIKLRKGKFPGAVASKLSR